MTPKCTNRNTLQKGSPPLHLKVVKRHCSFSPETMEAIHAFMRDNDIREFSDAVNRMILCAERGYEYAMNWHRPKSGWPRSHAGPVDNRRP